MVSGLMETRPAPPDLDPVLRARLMQRRDGPGLRALALHAGAIGLTGWAIAAGVPGWPLLLPVQGVLIIAMLGYADEWLGLRRRFAVGAG